MTMSIDCDINIFFFILLINFIKIYFNMEKDIDEK